MHPETTQDDKVESGASNDGTQGDILTVFCFEKYRGEKDESKGIPRCAVV